MVSPERHFVVFEVAGALCALPSASVVEVLPIVDLDRPPGAPAVLSGFLNLGGRPLAVISARALFEAKDEAAPGLYAHVLRLASPDSRADLGLLVDRVIDVAVAAEGSAPLDQGQTLNGMVVETLLIDGRVTPLLDLSKLLLQEETLRIGALAGTAAARLGGWSEAPV